MVGVEIAEFAVFHDKKKVVAFLEFPKQFYYMWVFYHLHIAHLWSEVFFKTGMFGELFFRDDFDSEGKVVVLDAISEKYCTKTAATDFLN